MEFLDEMEETFPLPFDGIVLGYCIRQEITQKLEKIEKKIERSQLRIRTFADCCEWDKGHSTYLEIRDKTIAQSLQQHK